METNTENKKVLIDEDDCIIEPVILYFAVDGDGTRWLFTSRPTRDEKSKEWIGRTFCCVHHPIMLDEGLLSKSWKDQPVQVIGRTLLNRVSIPKELF